MNYYFVVRVELNNHDEGDYTLLHSEMENIGFFRAVKASNDIWYDLPTGEYVRISDSTFDYVQTLLDNTLNAFLAKKPRNRFGYLKDYEHLLSKSESLRFKLKINTDSSKRPR
jgi:hypothetical protein